MITPLDINDLLDNCSLVYIPFDDGALATSARVVTMENGTAVEVFDGNELDIGSTTTDPFGVQPGYFTPLNKTGENEDNYVSIKRGDSELLLPDWLQDHYRLDTLVGNGHLVFGGYCYFKDGTGGGQMVMSAELGTNPVVGGGVGVAMASGEKIAGYMRQNIGSGGALLTNPPNGTMVNMMANSSQAASGVKGVSVNGVTEYPFPFLVHYDFITMQQMVYMNGSEGNGSLISIADSSLPDCTMDYGWSLFCQQNSGFINQLVNETVTDHNSFAQLYSIRVENESSRWVSQLAYQHFHTFDLMEVLS